MDITSFFNQKLNSLESAYDKATARKKLLYYIAAYTVAFLAVFFIAWSPFLLGHKTFVWSIDGRMEQYPVLAYLGRAVRKCFLGILNGKGFSLPMFDVHLGLGADVVGNLNPDGLNDPLLLFSIFVPTAYTEALYGFLVIFRLYLAGLSFTFLCRYFRKCYSHSLIGSMIYCFTGLSITYSMSNPFLTVPMIQLPLLIVGLDRILKKEKPYIFILAMFYSALSQYYSLYMMTIMMFVYALVRFFDLYKENRFKEFFAAFLRVACFYIFGICLAAAVLLPAMVAFSNAGRSGFHNYTGHYPWSWYLTRGLLFIAPPGGEDNMAYAAIIVPALVCLFASKSRCCLKLIVCAALLIFFSSIGGLIMNGFQYPTHRWVYGLDLVIAFAVVEMLPDLLKLSKRNLVLCGLAMCFYTIVAFSTKDARNTGYVLMGVAFFAFTLFLLATNKYIEKTRTLTTFGLLLVVFNVGMNVKYKFASDKGNFIKRFEDYGYETKRLHDEIEWELEPSMQENPQGRFDSTTCIPKIANIWRVPTMLHYNSVENKNIINFWTAIENSGCHQNFYMYSTGQQTIATTLLSEKYYGEKNDNKKYIPYGYSFKQKTNSGNFVYENNFALPWGYTYDNVMSYTDMEEMNGLARQEAMMQAIALEDTKNYQKAKLEFAEQKLPYKIECKDCEWKNGILKVNKANATIKLLFDMPANVEGYLRLHKLDSNDSGKSRLNLNVMCNDIKRETSALSKLFKWYPGRENYLFNLGYSLENRNELTIILGHSGTFKLADIELFALPMQNYEKQVNDLRAEPLENIEWGTNKISGTVNLSKDKILCMSVPYSKGWTAYVDGEKTKILRGNYMFMAVPLKAGRHDIVFKYCSPGIKLGAVISLASLIVLILMLIRDKRKCRCEKK